jgi:hypothetical protein
VGISRPCLFALARARPLSWFVNDAGDDAIADSLSLITWGSMGGKAAGSRGQWRGRPFSWYASSMSPACVTDELKDSAKPKGANACCSGDARSAPQHDPNYEARETILDGWAMQCSRPDLVARSTIAGRLNKTRTEEDGDSKSSRSIVMLESWAAASVAEPCGSCRRWISPWQPGKFYDGERPRELVLSRLAWDSGLSNVMQSGPVPLRLLGQHRHREEARPLSA